VIAGFNNSCLGILSQHSKVGDHYHTALALSTFFEVVRVLCDKKAPGELWMAISRWSCKFAASVTRFKNAHFIGIALAPSTLPGSPFQVHIGAM